MTEKPKTDKTLSGVSSDDPRTILNPSVDKAVDDDLETVVVTTTVVEKTEVSVVKMVQQQGEPKKGTENEKEGLFGNLGGEDEGLKVNWSENGTSVVMEDAEGSLAGQNNVKELTNHDKEEEDHNHNFVFGDFVWGKLKGRPWWPGQIYDPNDASDNAAATVKRNGHLLVAFFGDRPFSWCSPSQLKPFIDNFDEMSGQSESKKFANAVQKVLEEVSRRLDAELRCKCQTGNKTKNAGVVNNGIKKGVRAPKGNTIKVLIDRMEPVEVVSTVKGYATMQPGTRLVALELAVVKSCLRAFYSKKDGFLLVDYRDPKCIEGLEEETRSAVHSDIISPSGSPDNGDDKLYQRRKQKSVAELMGEDEPKSKKAKATKEGGTKDRKRKALMVSVSPESDHENGSGGGIEEEITSPRQRKKSRYLSPPYLSPIGLGNGKFSGTGAGSFKEPKTEPEKVPEMAAEQLEDSLKKSSRKKSREKRRVREGSEPQEHKTTTDTVVGVAEVLAVLVRAALDPSSVQKESFLTMTELVSSFRSSMFKGFCNQTGKKKHGEDASEFEFVKRKLEWMKEMVQMCKEGEMSADVKASLEGGLQEVLGKVVKMKGN